MGFINDLIPLFMPQYWRKDEPVSHAPHKYDPQFGFEDKPRQLKYIPATVAEMDSAGLSDQERDFCAKFRIHYKGCLREHAPFWWQCKGLKNEMVQCYWEEKIHDMKEFEREKRLNVRERILREGKA